MSAQHILGVKQNFTPTFLCRNAEVIKQAQNGESLWNLQNSRSQVIINNMTKANPVRKIFSEVNKAYISGLLDGDGAIMACIEKHAEKKFGFRIRIYIKISQNNEKILNWCKFVTGMGNVRNVKGKEYEWRIRDQIDARLLLDWLILYLRIKKRQAVLATRILDTKIENAKQLLKIAKLADTLSALNVRSEGRRKNVATMIQDSISPND